MYFTVLRRCNLNVLICLKSKIYVPIGNFVRYKPFNDTQRLYRDHLHFSKLSNGTKVNKFLIIIFLLQNTTIFINLYFLRHSLFINKFYSFM